MCLIIGIESCGKSFTVVAAADPQGNVLAAERHPFRLNFHEDQKINLSGKLFRVLKGILERCNSSVGDFVNEKGRICAGITGITTGYDRGNGMEEIWRRIGLSKLENKIATGGIEIEFAGATRSLIGASITSHVGSVAMARNEEKIVRVGGWGQLMGDEGSAYWIGIKALQTLCRLRDGRIQRKETDLARFVKKKLISNPYLNETIENHKNSIKGLINKWEDSYLWVDALITLCQKTTKENEFRYIVSDLANAVIKAWEHNPQDKIAFDLIDRAALELLQQGETAINKIGFENSSFPFVLWGGFFRYNKSFSDYFIAKVKEKWGEAEVIVPQSDKAMRPVIGALTIALSGTMFELPAPDVLKRLESSSTEFPDLIND